MAHFIIAVYNTKGGQMLQLSRAKEEDAGQYVCTATNTAGQDQKSILLSVYGKQMYTLSCVNSKPSVERTKSFLNYIMCFKMLL